VHFAAISCTLEQISSNGGSTVSDLFSIYPRDSKRKLGHRFSYWTVRMKSGWMRFSSVSTQTCFNVLTFFFFRI
jgi:hypothetical protein